MSVVTVLDYLRRRDGTTDEIAAATGLSRNAVYCAIRRAQQQGYTIQNTRRPGGHQPGYFRLLHDPDNPQRRVCAFAGCRTVLSASNGTAYCRTHLAETAYMVALLHLDAVLDEILGEVEDEQLCLV